MKQSLIKKINPILDAFVDDVLSTFGDLESIRKDTLQKQRQYEDLIEQKEKELKEIKQIKAKTREEIDQKITELEEAKSDYLQKSKNYTDLINELKSKQKEIDGNLEKSQVELIRSKEVRGQADALKDESEKLKNNYQLKLDSLKADEDKIANENTMIKSENVKLKARENDVLFNESRNEKKVQDLNDQELRIKVERKEIARLIERYNLNKQLQEH